MSYARAGRGSGRGNGDFLQKAEAVLREALGSEHEGKGIVSREIATALMKVGGLNLDDAKLIATIR